MSKGFIGLDNPSFKGNVRLHRRRQVVRPGRPAVQQVTILDDVKDVDAVVKETVVQSKAIPKSIDQQQKVIANKHISPLQSPAWHTSPAGAEISGSISARKRVPRSERYREKQMQQRQQSFEVVQTTSYLPESNQVEVISYEQFMAEQAQEHVQPRNKARRNWFGFLRKVPYFGKLTRKDLLTMRFALPAMAVTIFLVGCGVAIQGVNTNRQVKAQVAELSGVGEVTGYDPAGKEEVPDETKPDQKTWGPYVVAPNMPKYIRINKIGVNSRVMRVGVKPNNELIAPNNIHNVGWFEGSAKPGETGTALMDAHVHGPTMPGAFYKINKLSAGDQIEIEMGDGRRLNYKVVGTESAPYQNVDMAKAMRSQEEGKNGLNLITCGGKYNRESHMYEERVIVYAVQM